MEPKHFAWGTRRCLAWSPNDVVTVVDMNVPAKNSPHLWQNAGVIDHVQKGWVAPSNVNYIKTTLAATNTSVRDHVALHEPIQHTIEEINLIRAEGLLNYQVSVPIKSFGFVVR